MPAATSTSTRPLAPGVWAPIPTFFKEDESVDIPTFTTHLVRLAHAGMLPVISGSMGEAHHLTNEERTSLIVESRKALDAAGLNEVPIIAGTGVGSTRGTIQLCHEAAQAGADYAIVIPSGYYAGALSKQALKKYFLDVQEKSPIPVMVYNFPGAAGGIDMDSDLIIEIAKEGANICGVKLTCGAVGKLTRITAVTTSPSFIKQYPRKNANAPFLTLGGFGDFMVPAVLGGKGHGAIMGLGNIYPRALARLFELASQVKDSAASDPALLEEALQLQGLASDADWAFCLAGISGTKYYLQQTRGYGGVPRLPLLPFDEAKGKQLLQDHAVTAFMEVEKKLEAKEGKGANGQ
jgi:dihydrodipicolinate synthase/N-acetylneuraminate lyase